MLIRVEPLCSYLQLCLSGYRYDTSTAEFRDFLLLRVAAFVFPLFGLGRDGNITWLATTLKSVDSMSVCVYGAGGGQLQPKASDTLSLSRLVSPLQLFRSCRLFTTCSRDSDQHRKREVLMHKGHKGHKGHVERWSVFTWHLPSLESRGSAVTHWLPVARLRQ